VLVFRTRERTIQNDFESIRELIQTHAQICVKTLIYLPSGIKYFTIYFDLLCLIFLKIYVNIFLPKAAQYEEFCCSFFISFYKPESDSVLIFPVTFENSDYFFEIYL